MTNETTLLESTLDSTIFDSSGLMALSDEELMQIHGGSSLDGVNEASANPLVGFVVEVVKDIVVSITADAIVDGIRHPGPPQDTQAGNPSNGTEGRGSI